MSSSHHKIDWATRCLPGLFAYGQENSFVNRLRRKRMQALLGLLNTAATNKRPLRVLDIGGTMAFWNMLGGLPPERFEVVLLNLAREEVDPRQTHFTSVAGSALDLPFDDHSFDVAFSNSVIEHVGSEANQRIMAAEVKRVSVRHIIQTPSLWFPFEPHARLPLFQFLPRPVRAFLIYHFTINYFPKAPSYRECLAVSDSTILLTRRKFQALFPDSLIVTERLLGIAKSYVALGGWDTTSGNDYATGPT